MTVCINVSCTDHAIDQICSGPFPLFRGIGLGVRGMSGPRIQCLAGQIIGGMRSEPTVHVHVHEQSMPKTAAMIAMLKNIIYSHKNRSH